jgi:putative PIN family toxin of toxin-antitoxin system
MTNKSINVIIDTNVWISFLIGKRLGGLKELIVTNKIQIVYTDQLIAEIKRVTKRPKLSKFFPEKSVREMITLIETIGQKTEITPVHFINRDPKDNFLLDLIDFSKADYLVTGDKDLLLHNPFKSAKILTPSEFEEIILKTR